MSRRSPRPASRDGRSGRRSTAETASASGSRSGPRSSPGFASQRARSRAACHPRAARSPARIRPPNPPDRAPGEATAHAPRTASSPARATAARPPVPFPRHQGPTLPARDQKSCFLCSFQPLPHRHRGVVCHLLEVVKDHEAPPAGGDGMPELLDRIAASELDSKRPGDRGCNPARTSCLRQVAEPHSTWPLTEAFPSIAHREAGLSHPSRTEERQQARGAGKMALELLDLHLPAHECVPLGRQRVQYPAAWARALRLQR